MSNQSLDLIRDAYSKAIVQYIENDNFSQIKFLVDNLEKLTVELKSVPVSSNSIVQSSMPSLFDLESSNPNDFAVSLDEMRDFVIAYVTTHGTSNADEVADAFELHYQKKFNALDLSVTERNTSPRWRRRLHSVVVKLRQEGVFMPHEFPYFYKYAFTQAYLNGSKEISVVM